MQIHTRIQLTGVLVLMLFFISCNKTNQQGRFIPKDAAVVMQVDGKSLLSKLSWEEIKQNPLFKELYKDSTLPAAVKSLLENPENSGINVNTDLLLFIQKDSIGAYIGFEGSIKNVDVFKEFNKQMTGKESTSEPNGINYISSFPLCVGWNKEKFAYVFDAPAIAHMDQLSRRMMNDSIDLSNNKPRDIGANCKALFDLKEDNSFAKEARFTKLLKEPGDIRFWMNTESLNKGTLASPALAMLNLDKLYKGSITTAVVNFENGKISLSSKSYSGEELTKLFKKYGGGKINDDMLKRLPGKDVVAVMALHFNPEAIRELIKMTNLDGLLNIGLSQMGITMDDFIKANKGDVMVALSSLNIKKDSISYTLPGQEPISYQTTKPDPSYFFTAAIADKDAFNKLINAVKKIGGREMGDSSKAPFAYNTNGTYFTISNTAENVDRYLGKSSNNFDFISKINDQPFGGYVNIQTIMKAFETEVGKDSSAQIAYVASLKMWDNLVWKGGNISGDAITQSIEITLVDRSTNSLQQLNQYVNKLTALYEESKKKYPATAANPEDVTTTEAIPLPMEEKGN